MLCPPTTNFSQPFAFVMTCWRRSCSTQPTRPGVASVLASALRAAPCDGCPSTAGTLGGLVDPTPLRDGRCRGEHGEHDGLFHVGHSRHVLAGAALRGVHGSARPRVRRSLRPVGVGARAARGCQASCASSATRPLPSRPCSAPTRPGPRTTRRRSCARHPMRLHTPWHALPAARPAHRVVAPP